jgi:8-oxo-dGTP pyrophosphatase MutT (NUDIX family)
LRELHEELGVALGEGAVLGWLDDYPTRSGYLITPVVVWVAANTAIAPNPDEVASVHRIALDDIERDDASASPAFPRARDA